MAISASKKIYTKGFLTVLNEKGLHTRPSTELVKCAMRFKSHIKISHKGATVNAKSLLGILTLAIIKGSKVLIEAEGHDSNEAIDALKNLAKKNFNMDKRRRL